MTTPLLNSEVMRELVECMFKKSENVATFVQFALSSKQALQALHSTLTNRLRIDMFWEKFYFFCLGIKPGIAFPTEDLSDKNMEPVYLLCKFVKKMEFDFFYYAASRWSDEQNKCLEKLIAACRNCTKFSYHRKVGRKHVVPPGIDELAQSVPCLSVSNAYLQHLCSKVEALPLVTTLLISLGSKNSLYMPSEAFVPNVTTLTLFNPHSTSYIYLKSKLTFSKVKHLTIQTSYETVCTIDNFKEMFSLMENLPALKTAEFFCNYQDSYTDGEIVQHAFNDIKHDGVVSISLDQKYNRPSTDADTTGFRSLNDGEHDPSQIWKRTLSQNGKNLQHTIRFRYIVSTIFK
uniref:F-box domain-containing protein n=1 Tax=Panagrellus redivivus TaxID=6233 RepID=A0A7E4UT44_PANRE